jgi:hypothetical protein
MSLKAFEDVEKLGILHTACGNIKKYGHISLEDSLENSNKCCAYMTQ